MGEFSQSVNAGKWTTDHLCWYAIHTRSRHEKRIELSLRQAGVDTFLPLIREVHRWSDWRQEVQLPLFPCYLFVHVVPGTVARLTVLKTPGVLNFVGTLGSESAIPEQEIEQVRAVVTQQGSFFPCPFLKTGQRIRIRGGALDGVEGVLNSHKGASTLVVSVELIQRSVSVLIDGYDVEAA